MVPEALGASVRAGRAAECVGAPAEAAKQYERAIELWDAVPDAEARAGATHSEMLLMAAEMVNLCGYFERSIALLREAIDEVDPEVEPAWAGILHERMGRYLWAADQDALPECEEAVRLVPAEPPSPERAKVLAGYARMLMLTGEQGAARGAAEEAIDMAVRAGSHDAEGDARNTLGTCLVPLGQVDEGLAEIHRSREIAEELGRVEEIGRALVNLCHSPVLRRALARPARAGPRRSRAHPSMRASIAPTACSSSTTCSTVSSPWADGTRRPSASAR